MAIRYSSYVNQATANLKAKFANETAPDHPIALEDRLIATVDRNTYAVNVSAYLKANIFGILLECGSYYDQFHQVRSQPENPNYDRMCEQFQYAKMPFGIYIETRATSVTDANREIAAISIAARRNAPTLGIWLHLRFSSSQSSATNNQIITRYQNAFNEWGYQNDMGLITTTSQIRATNWGTFQSSWLLWWEEHVTDLSMIPKLTANDFKVK